MAEVANGVTGQNQSFNVLRNYDGHDYLHVFFIMMKMIKIGINSEQQRFFHSCRDR